MRDGVPADIADAAIRDFLACYDAAVPWRCEPERVAWYTTVFLLGKTHSLFKKHDAAGVANAALAFERLEEWSRRAAG